MSPVEFFTDYTYRTVFIGTTLIGLVAGALGAFAYLRKQSLIGDVVAHSALPGVLLTFILAVGVFGAEGRSMVLLTLGAVVTGTLAVLCFRYLESHSKIKTDAAMAIVLTGFFGTGLLLLRVISNGNFPGKGGVHDYLFGNASVLTRSDIITIAVVGVVALAAVFVLWKEFAIRSFDAEMASVMGYNGRVIDLAMFSVIVLAIVIGVKAVGVVLMIAFVVTPPAAARQWVKTLPAMVVLSGVFGAAGSAVGAYISVAFDGLPTGPTIVLSLFAIFVVSLFFAPERSVLRRLMKRRQLRQQLLAHLANSKQGAAS